MAIERDVTLRIKVQGADSAESDIDGVGSALNETGDDATKAAKGLDRAARAQSDLNDAMDEGSGSISDQLRGFDDLAGVMGQLSNAANLLSGVAFVEMGTQLFELGKQVFDFATGAADAAAKVEAIRAEMEASQARIATYTGEVMAIAAAFGAADLAGVELTSTMAALRTSMALKQLQDEVAGGVATIIEGENRVIELQRVRARLVERYNDLKAKQFKAEREGYDLTASKARVRADEIRQEVEANEKEQKRLRALKPLLEEQIAIYAKRLPDAIKRTEEALAGAQAAASGGLVGKLGGWSEAVAGWLVALPDQPAVKAATKSAASRIMSDLQIVQMPLAPDLVSALGLGADDGLGMFDEGSGDGEAGGGPFDAAAQMMAKFAAEMVEANAESALLNAQMDEMKSTALAVGKAFGTIGAATGALAGGLAAVGIESEALARVQAGVTGALMAAQAATAYADGLKALAGSPLNFFTPNPAAAAANFIAAGAYGGAALAYGARALGAGGGSVGTPGGVGAAPSSASRQSFGDPDGGQGGGGLTVNVVTGGAVLSTAQDIENAVLKAVNSGLSRRGSSGRRQLRTALGVR